MTTGKRTSASRADSSRKKLDSIFRQVQKHLGDIETLLADCPATGADKALTGKLCNDVELHAMKLCDRAW